MYFNADYHNSLALFKQCLKADKTFYKLTLHASDIVSGDYPVSGELYHNYASNLRKAVDVVFNGEEDSDLALRLKAGVTRFGAFKAYNATQDIRAKGRSGAATAADDAENVEKRYNSFQAAEYNTAASRARTAKQWEEFSDSDRMDIFPNLKWLPSTSAEPREAHRVFWNRIWAKTDPFWNTNQPGNLWNCKCDWHETDEPPTDGNPQTSTSARGLDGNPAQTGKIFSDDCSYIKRVKDTSTEAYKMVEKECNYFESLKNIRDNTLKTNLTAKTCPCIGENSTPITICMEQYGFEECFGKMITADSETYLLKNEVVKRWEKYLQNAVYVVNGRRPNDMTHNHGRNPRNHFKRQFDYFDYFEFVLPNGETAYFNVAHSRIDGKYYIWTITTRL